jgi:hypothetical protein
VRRKRSDFPSVHVSLPFTSVSPSSMRTVKALRVEVVPSQGEHLWSVSNPAHLAAGTQRANIHDTIARGAWSTIALTGPAPGPPAATSSETLPET